MGNPSQVTQVQEASCSPAASDEEKKGPEHVEEPRAPVPQIVSTKEASSPTTSDEEKGTEHIEDVPALAPHPSYYDGGMRTYGDGEDHDHEPPVGGFLTA